MKKSISNDIYQIIVSLIFLLVPLVALILYIISPDNDLKLLIVISMFLLVGLLILLNTIANIKIEHKKKVIFNIPYMAIMCLVVTFTLFVVPLMLFIEDTSLIEALLGSFIGFLGFIMTIIRLMNSKKKKKKRRKLK